MRSAEMENLQKLCGKCRKYAEILRSFFEAKKIFLTRKREKICKKHKPPLFREERKISLLVNLEIINTTKRQINSILSIFWLFDRKITTKAIYLDKFKLKLSKTVDLRS